MKRVADAIIMEEEEEEVGAKLVVDTEKGNSDTHLHPALLPAS